MSSTLHRGALGAAVLPLSLALVLASLSSAVSPAHAAKAHVHRTTKAKATHERRARVAVSSARLAAPTLWVESYRLRWNPRSVVGSYYLATKVPGVATTYRVVTGTGFTPPAVPGKTVTYGLRTTYSGSRWGIERTIAYPATIKPSAPTTPTTPPAATPPAPAPAPAPTPAPSGVPVLHVDGQVLRWSTVAGISSYVVATKVPGRATSYRHVTGTSDTPAAVPGTTVAYGLRADVDGAAWAEEQSITYPQATSEPSPPGGGAFLSGINVGSWGDHTQPANDAALLRAKNIRLGVSIQTSTSTLDSYFDRYWAKGISVMLLAEFEGRVPTSSESRSVAAWASRYGAGGSYWTGKANPTPTRWIEFGNETAYTYQFSDNSAWTYAQRAKDYAARVREARQAMDAQGSVARGVGLLAQSDPNPAWTANMFAGVPEVASYVAGWTMHPYGPPNVIRDKMDSAMANLAGQGAEVTASKPMFITEYGIASDNGRTLQSNYGWPRNLTYAQAADSYRAAESTMRGTYGNRLRLLIIYCGRDQKSPGTTDYQEHYFGSLTNNNWGMVGAPKGEITTAVQGIMDHGA